MRVSAIAILAAVILATVVGPSSAAVMPPATQNFLGMGTTLGGCVFPAPVDGEPAGCTTTGIPPDVTGAAGLNDYVEATNSGYAVFDKTGGVIQSPQFLHTLWAGYTGANAGNDCSSSDGGEPIVRYDQLADRWVIMELSLPGGGSSAPAFECVAVSKTGDPTGGWWRYDYEYNQAVDDSASLGVWTDGYYATFNMYGANGVYDGADICAWNRAAMLAGPDANTAAEAQQCFQQSSSVFGVTPANVDGPVPPPAGSPEYLVSLGGSSTLTLYKFHVDWTTPGNSTLASTSITVPSFTKACGGSGACIVQPTPGNQLIGVGDRPMDRVVYRNFGTYESLILDHSVLAGSVTGIRWYEIRDPNGAHSLFQSGTYAPSDGAYRWMGSIAEDQAGDMALGFSLSDATTDPSIAWTGRLATDAAGAMPQGEATVESGSGVEAGSTPGGSPANLWGIFSSMTVDPADDCTFWYANEYYPSNGVFDWDTRIASFRFPNCAANDFSVDPSPDTASVDQGSSTQTTIDTTLTNGSAEPVTLTAQDLPNGVTASFGPTTPSAGESSTLTFDASPSAALGTYTVGVIAQAASAVHYTTVTLTVTDPTTADFSIGADPPSVSADQGANGHTTIDTAVTAGSPQDIDFQASGLPDGATASFDPAPIVAGQTSTLTLSAGAATPPGIYDVQVTGTESPSGAQHSTDVSFTVIAVHTLTVVTSGGGAGSVTSDVGGIDCGEVCQAQIADGTEVTLTAAADAGSAFTGWSGGGCSGTGTCQVAVTADTTVTANFTVTDTLTVEKSGSGSGTVTSADNAIDCGDTCAHDYADGTEVTLTAVPAQGSDFTGWSGGACAGSANPVCQVQLVDATDVTVTATFVPTHTLTVESAGAGSGTVTSDVGGIDCGSTCAAVVDDGTQVTLNATPDAGSAFAGWSGGGCSGAGSCLVTVTADTTVTATFVPTHTLTVVRAGAGSGTVTSDVGAIDCGSSCAGVVDDGTQVNLVATADAGSVFTGWSGGSCSGAGTCQVTVIADTTVTATFALVQCVVPNVKGKTEAAAKRAIVAGHCAVGKITKAASKKVAKGKVISQSPRAGNHLKKGSKVNLVVSKGKKR